MECFSAFVAGYEKHSVALEADFSAAFRTSIAHLYKRFLQLNLHKLPADDLTFPNYKQITVAENYEVLLSGPFESVEASYSDTSPYSWRPENREVESEMYDRIQDWLLVTEDKGLPTFNGTKTRLKDYSCSEDVLELELGEIDFYSHVATRGIEDLRYEDRPNTLGVSARAVTSDGLLVIGKKSQNNEVGADEYCLPSGLAEADFEESLGIRELKEETGLHEEDILEITPGDLISAMNHPHIVYDVKTDISFNEFYSRWMSSDNDELSGLAGLPVENIPDTLEGVRKALVGTEERIVESEEEFALRPHTKLALETF